MTPARPPLFSIIVVNYNGLSFLKGCFDSLLGTTYPSVEILMVDNGSTDGSVPFVERNYPQVKLIKSPTNLSYSGGNNLGIRHASGDYIVLLNNDTEVTPGWLEPLAEEFASDRTIAACQPKILMMTDRSSFEYAGAAGGYMDWFGFPFLRGRIFDVIEQDHGQYQNQVDLFWTSGAAMAIRKSVLDEIGLLDEDFVLHMEEIDLCWRMHLMGYRLRARPDAVIYHFGGGTLGRDRVAKLYYNIRNSIFMLLKNVSARRLFWVLPIRALLDLAFLFKSLFTLDVKRAAAVPAAYAWLLIHLRLILKKRREIQRRRTVSDMAIDPLLYPGSLVVAYFIGRKRTFTELWPRE
ncbi:MAG: glycosyltransferase family 2 protein [Candidatus Marinimicrobia bacterium]|nr:glycosyltransferase family 2 protein [Candidatus Neomarinimicrobiota bacterium]